MNSTPLISVIVPVYNVADHVAACLRSLQAQTLADIEVLVIDDGSTDDSGAIARSTVAGDPRFQVIAQTNKGLSGARNTGLETARGAFIAFVDSDDRVMPDYLMRLWQALDHSGADWVACAIRSVLPDGAGYVHSAIHGAPRIADHPAQRRYALSSWSDVIRHFPSAWNKLYRRQLIEGLRFDEGTWFEDHTFFYRAANRTDHLLHLPEALYLQTRGRPGQITSSDDDRVFQQFDVMREMRALMSRSPRPGADLAFARIASRLIFERSTALRDPERRARFARAAAEFLADEGLAYDTAWDPDIGQAFGLEMAGEIPLSVLIPWDGTDLEALNITLTALADQSGPGRRVLVLGPEGAALPPGHPDTRLLPAPASVGAALRTGLQAAEGRYLMMLYPGDRPAPMALHDAVETMLRAQAQVGVMQYHMGTDPEALPHNGFDDMRPMPQGTPHTGELVLTPQAVLGLSPEIATRIFERAFLRTSGLGFTDTAHPDWALGLAAPLLAERLAYLAWPAIAVDMRPQAARHRALPRTAHALAKGHDAMLRSLPKAARQALPHGWQRRLFARAIRQTLSFAPPLGRAAKARLLAGLPVAAAMRGLTGAQLDSAGFDPSVGPRLAQLLNPLGLIGGAQLAPPQSALASPSEGADKASSKPGENQMLFAFKVQKSAVFRFRADFQHARYANITFFTADKQHAPFHLSLRFDEGEVVANDTRPDGAWRQERLRKMAFPAGSVEGRIEISPPHVIVSLGGAPLFRLGRRTPLNRGGLRDLDQITFLELQGEILTLDLRSDAGTARADLHLDSRLQLRAPCPSDGATLTAGPQDIPLVLTDTEGGAFADLPGRIWRDIEPESPVFVTLSTSGATSQLSLTRPELAQRIETLMQHPPSAADAGLVLQILDHLRHGQLHAHLSASCLDKLGHLAERFGLSDYIAGPTEAAPSLPLGEDETAQIEAAMARFHQAMTAPGTQPAPIAVVRDLALPRPARQRLFMALADVFCRQGQDFDALYALAQEEGLARMIPAQDVWGLSAQLPFLLRAGDGSAVVEAMERLVKPGQGWVLTPPYAWTVRHAARAAGLADKDRDHVLRAYLGFLKARADDYWDRTHCRELTHTAAVLAMDPRADYLGRELWGMILRSYGLSRVFWTEVDIQVSAGARLSPDLRTARALFDRLRTPQPDRAAVAEALDWFARAKCVDAPRLRTELLGPAGIAPAVPEASDLLLHSTAPQEAALRYAAFPTATPPDAPALSDALSELVAESLPAFYPKTPLATAPDVQARALAQTKTLLDAPKSVTDTGLSELLNDLSRLCGERTQFLGVGLALVLIPVLADQTESHATALRLADWLETRHGAMPPDTRSALRRAAFVQVGSLALARRGGALADRLVPLFGPSLDSIAHGHEDNTGLPAPHPLHDTLVTVFSCKPYLDSRLPALKAGWLSLLDQLGIPWVVVVGDGDGRRDGEVVHLEAPDDYEGLPQKTLATIDWVYRNTRFAYMLKIDDDCFLNAPVFFEALTYRKFHYYGRKLTRGVGQMDRAWHQGKSTSDRGRYELDRSPEPSAYADGGSGYTLSRPAMAATLEAAASPEGRRLIAQSFMEDKMLGDLLAMRGIFVADEDYLVSVRRRTSAEAKPVAAWLNSFFPNRTAPLHLIHLDTEQDQASTLAGLDSTGLIPPKIWPSFQPPKLGYQSNALELLSDPATLEAARRAPVAVVAAMRNEMFMLPHFLAHYRGLGVTSFLIADNTSDDGTREYLLAQPDVALFSVDTDYRLSHYGVAWQQAMIAAFRVGKWSLVADADELLVWQQPQRESLPDLLARPEMAQAEAVRIFMLDMYPEGPLEAARFDSGDPFAEAGFTDAQPFLSNTPAGGPFTDATMWTSALRHRLIPGSRSTLFVAQKLALLRYHPFMRLADGLHFVGDAVVAEKELIFAHFKYNAAFREKARTEVARKQHFNDAEEYRKYLALASEGRSVIHEPGVSVPWDQSAFVTARLERPT